jgi:hypothetical protein
VTQRGKSQEDDSLLLAKIEQLGFRKIRMRFDLDYRRLDSGRFIDRPELVQADVRESDGAALAAIDQIFHGLPGIEQSHAAIVEHVAVGIARILFIAGLKGKRGVN